MKLLPLIGALLISAQPVSAQIQFTCCIENKDSQIQEAEKAMQMAAQYLQNPASVEDLANQLEEARQFAAGLSQEEKNSKARTFIQSQINKLKSELEKAKKYPDCSQLRGVQ